MRNLKKKTLHDIEISYSADVSDTEILHYIDYVDRKSVDKLVKLEIKTDGEEVDLSWEFKPIKFDRIRRITGYLSGTMDTWNQAKTAEEHDRVKHDVGMERL